MKNIIKELDAALADDSGQADLEASLTEENPDAPAQAIENAVHLNDIAEQLRALTKHIKQKREARRRQREAKKAERRRRVESAKVQIAALAVEQGVASEEEKRLVKQAPRATDSATDYDSGLEAAFDPTTGS
jgi:hypothetical protein